MLELLKELQERLTSLENTFNNIVRIGRVVNRYPEKGTVRVEFERADDKDKTTSYELSVLQPKTLKDKFFYIPEENEYVVCVFLPYASDVGFVVGAYYNKNIPSPSNSNNKFVKKIDGLLNQEMDKDGKKISFDLNGNIESKVIEVKHKGKVFVEGDVFIKGNLVVSGNISDLNGSKGNVADLRNTFNSHNHTDSIGGDTTEPNQKVGE